MMRYSLPKATLSLILLASPGKTVQIVQGTGRPHHEEYRQYRQEQKGLHHHRQDFIVLSALHTRYGRH